MMLQIINKKKHFCTQELIFISLTDYYHVLGIISSDARSLVILATSVFAITPVYEK